MPVMLDAGEIAQIVREQDGDAEVSPSTLHYYVQVGILPGAVGRGRNGYTPEHLSRFRLARHLRREGLGLAEIRNRLTGLTPEKISAELARLQRQPSPPAVGAPAAQPPVAAGSGRSVSLDRRAAATRYSLASEALSARPGDAPRTLRFRGGFSLQVPAGTSDDQIARLYAAVEAALNEEPSRSRRNREEEEEPR